MKKIINTFKYGDREVKRILFFAILAGMAAVGCTVAAIVVGEMLLFFGAVLGIFVTIFLLQTLEIRSEDRQQKEPVKQEAVTQREEPVKQETPTQKEELLEQEAPTQKEEQVAQEVLMAQEEPSKKEKPAKIKKKKKAKKKTKKQAKKQKKDTTEQEEPEVKVVESQQPEVKSEEQHSEGKQAEKRVPEIKQVTEDELQSYSKQKIKKTMHKYKVKRDHRMVFVDHCEKLNIYQTPAYIWVHDKEFHLLLIESEPRHVVIPLARINQITYLKKHPAHMDVDYAPFKGNSLIAQVFKPYLPDYTFSTVVNDMTAYKNLYGVGPDIYFTNRSAKSLFDFFGVEFKVIDKVTMSNKVNNYFKDAYKANILLRDNVIDANGYADSISSILDGMAKSTMSYNEFKDTLNLMVKNKLITQEFAMYYMSVRDKNLY